MCDDGGGFSSSTTTDSPSCGDSGTTSTSTDTASATDWGTTSTSTDWTSVNVHGPPSLFHPDPFAPHFVSDSTTSMHDVRRQARSNGASSISSSTGCLVCQRVTAILVIACALGVSGIVILYFAMARS